MAVLRRGGVWVAMAALALGAVGSVAARADPRPSGAPVLSASSLLAWLVDPGSALRPLPPGLRVVEHSSHDRTGGNDDNATFDPLTEALGLASDSRVEPDGAGGDAYVMFDERRPGCLTRMWMTGIAPNLATGSVGEGSLAGFGTIQFLFDGASSPALSVPAVDLFSGKVSGFPAPLVGDADVSSGGSYSYVPICFAKSLEVRAVHTTPSAHYFQFDALLGATGTPVQEYSATGVADAAAAAVSAMAGAGQPPSGPPTTTVAANVRPGAPASLTFAGAGQMTYLRVHVVPFDIAHLSAARVAIRTDGAASPQVDVPLADLFGDGLEVRAIRSLAFGAQPAQQSGYFALPVPFGNGLVVTLSSPAPTTVQVDAWVDRTTPPSARLYGEHHQETTTIGKDFTVLDAGGSGRLAAWVLDLVGQPGSSAFQSYMEGNPRIYIDGSRSPSIIGTGTEDTFNGAWYYQNGAFSLLTHGAGPLGKPSSLESSQSQYRVFGGDGPLWADAIHFGMQHGAGDENVTTAANTTFSYRTPGILVRTDALAPADRASDAAHHLTGPVRPTTLSAYFEGERDGNITVPLVPLLGSRLAPPPALSPDGVTAPGIGFDGPISFDLTVTAGCDIRLRRLLDAGTASTMAVAVAGQTVGTWAITEANGWKRWREDDFEIPAAFAGGHGQIRVTLSPTAGRATLYGLTAYADC